MRALDRLRMFVSPCLCEMRTVPRPNGQIPEMWLVINPECVHHGKREDV